MWIAIVVSVLAGVLALLFLRARRAAPRADAAHAAAAAAARTPATRNAERTVSATTSENEPTSEPTRVPAKAVPRQRALVLFATIAGQSQQFAAQLAARLRRTFAAELAVECANMADYEPDDLLGEDGFVFVVSATYSEGTPPAAAARVYEWLTWEADSPRSGSALRRVRFAVFGLGNSVYKKSFNAVGRTFDRCFYQLGATRVCRCGLGDETLDVMEQFDKWSAALEKKLAALLGSAVAQRIAAQAAAGAVDDADDDADAAIGVLDSTGDDNGEPVMDMEDMGSSLDGDVDAETTEQLLSIPNDERREMISDLQRKTLTKQGYKLIGSHSAVKMCRWTKAQLRGRGGCYKHTFYGITSYQCMEMTPSLACANKCVFCWRHHKNPVGRDFVWKMDPPEMLVEGGIKRHVAMINQLRGVPGVVPERFEEAFKPRHCALSLVGEPIVYPEINRFCKLLHERGISSFLVTNAQFPEQIEKLVPVTQLYISCDAATKEDLKAVDRPIFEDFWERFTTSIDALAHKPQRTVFRLTLVAKMNMTGIAEYAALVRRGRPDFVEIKGVTFCGSGKTNPLTMANVPWHDDVVEFSTQLCEAIGAVDGLEYGVASEHEHSNCVLLARKDRFWRDDKWHTWIDFDKFLDLEKAGEPFDSTDYMLETPHWAQFGSEHRGFDPGEQRHRRGKPVLDDEENNQPAGSPLVGGGGC